MIRELLPWLLPIGKYILASAVLLAFYRFFLKKRASYHESRVFLLSVAFLALLVSQFRIPVTHPAPTYVEVEQVLPIVEEAMNPVASVPLEPVASMMPETILLLKNEQPVSKKISFSTSLIEAMGWFGSHPWRLLIALYVCGLLMLVYNLLYQFVGIRRLRTSGTVSWEGTVRVVEHDDVSTPYSFTRTIFMPTHLDEHQRELALTHERFHIHHKHYVDVLLQEILVCLFWFNPVLWFIRYELRNIHEFQADRSVLNGGYDIYQYQLVILQEVTGSHSMLTSGLNHSITKKRFLHMQQSEPIPTGLIQKITLVSVVTVLFCLFCLVEGHSQVIRRNPINPSGNLSALDSSRIDSDTLYEQKKQELLAELRKKSNAPFKGPIRSLTLDFSPVGIRKSQVLIETINSIHSLTLINSITNSTRYLSESSMDELNLFFEDYFQKKFTYDSLELIKKLDLEKRGIHDVSPDRVKVHVSLVDQQSVKSFDFEVPDRGSIDHTFMKLFFKLINSLSGNGNTYLQKLEGYFNLGLGVRKSEVSFEYQIYGWVSSYEVKELNELFDQIPSDKEYAFNMSNFDGMDKTCYKSFKSLCDRNPRISWRGCSDKVKQQLIEAGINPSQIDSMYHYNLEY